MKLSTGQVDPADFEAATAEIRIKRKRQKKVIEVAEPFKAKKFCDVAVVSKALSGRTICVLSDDQECSKEELEDIVKSHGGMITQNCSMLILLLNN